MVGGCLRRVTTTWCSSGLGKTASSRRCTGPRCEARVCAGGACLGPCLGRSEGQPGSACVESLCGHEALCRQSSRRYTGHTRANGWHSSLMIRLCMLVSALVRHFTTGLALRPWPWRRRLCHLARLGLDSCRGLRQRRQRCKVWGLRGRLVLVKRMPRLARPGWRACIEACGLLLTRRGLKDERPFEAGAALCCPLAALSRLVIFAARGSAATGPDLAHPTPPCLPKPAARDSAGPPARPRRGRSGPRVLRVAGHQGSP